MMPELPPHQYFVDQLTLFQPRGADSAHPLLPAPPKFFTFRSTSLKLNNCHQIDQVFSQNTSLCSVSDEFCSADYQGKISCPFISCGRLTISFLQKTGAAWAGGP